MDRGTEKHLRKQRERQNENKAAVRRCRQKEGNGYANIQLQIRPKRSTAHWSLNRRKKAEHIFPPIAGLRFVQHSLALYNSDGKIVNSTEWAARTFFLFPSPRHRRAFISLHLAPPLSVSSVHFFDSSFPVPPSADLPRIFHFFPRQMLQSISPLFWHLSRTRGRRDGDGD